MAQPNQESTPIDPANLPPKRKRGRPRKYDYDNPGSEQRGRYLQNKAFRAEANLSVVSSSGPQDFVSQANPTTLSNPGFQVSHSYSPTFLGHGVLPIPTQANNVGVGFSLNNQSLPVHTMPMLSSNYGAKRSQIEADSSGNSTHATLVAPGVNPSSACLGLRSEAVPAQTHSTANSANHSQVIPTKTNSISTSSHGPSDLLGMAVAGTLDGTFDAGYLLTVRVGNSGHVLKGLVFDPRLCVPVSTENDIAPLLHPVATQNGKPSSLIVEHSETLVSVPIHPVPASFAAPSQTINHMLETSKLPHTASLLGTNKVTPNDTNPHIMTSKADANGNDSRTNVPHALHGEVQAKTPHTLFKSSIIDIDQESPSSPQQVVVTVTRALDLLGSAVNKEMSPSAFNVPSEDQRTYIDGCLGEEQSVHQVKEPLIITAETLAANEEMHQTVESSSIVVSTSGGKDQNHDEEISQVVVQQLSDQITNKRESPYIEMRSEPGELNLVAQAMPQESTS